MVPATVREAGQANSIEVAETFLLHHSPPPRDDRDAKPTNNPLSGRSEPPIPNPFIPQYCRGPRTDGLPNKHPVLSPANLPRYTTAKSNRG